MSEPRRKLIFLWTYLEWGGAQVYFMATMKEALRDWDVLAVLPRASSPEMLRFLEEIGVSYELLDFHLDTQPAPTISRKLQRQWNRIRTEAATLQYLGRFDLRNSVLHMEISPWQSWQFLTVLALKRAKVFVTMHNAITSPAKWREAVWKARMKFVSSLPGFHIFASNEDTRNKVRTLVRAKFWERLPVTYTCVDPDQINDVLANGTEPNELRERHGYAADEVIVVCVGQFIDRKGRWVFLDAAKLLEQSGSEIKFIWVTPTRPSPDDAARVERYGLRNLRLLLSSDIGGSRREVLEFFRIGTMFALPSYVEGLPIALLEAMALGLPSISTNVYAIPEAVKHEETGLLIPSGDAAALAAAIERLVEERDLRERLGRLGRRFVMENFDERVAARTAIEHYKRCFDERA